MIKQIDVTVQGIVQGVSFRYYTRREAIRLGVAGWVANQADGTVRVIAQGEEPLLLQLIEFLKQGSPSARVENIKIEWKSVTKPFKRFKICLFPNAFLSQL